MHRTQRLLGLRRAFCSFGVALTFAVTSPLSHAMSSLDDEQMSHVDGEGIAMALENIRLAAAPTSYIEALGAPESGTQASNGTWLLGWGNYQWLGLSITGTGAGMAYNGSCSTSGTSGDLGCPIGTGSIANMAAFDNPYLLRVYSYSGYDMANNANVPNTVVELLGPNNMDTYRWSFWGQIMSMDNSTGTTAQNYLQSQAIIVGKPATFQFSPVIAGTQSSGSSANTMVGSTMRLFRTQTTNTSDPNYSALGVNYISSLSGNFRFSVNQTSTSPNAINQVPVFDDQEGLFYKNVYAYLPMGQLNYQSLVVNANGTASTSNGNFVLELTAIPQPSSGSDCLNGSASACAAFYGLMTNEQDASGYYGYTTAFASRAAFGSSGCTSGATWCNPLSAANTGYYQTHGYVDWGLYAKDEQGNCLSGCGEPLANYSSNPTAAASYTGDGIYFVSGNQKQDTFAPQANTPTGFGCSGSNGQPQCITMQTYNSANGNYPGSTNASVVNLGTAHVDGILIQHMQFTTSGAGH